MANYNINLYDPNTASRVIIPEVVKQAVKKNTITLPNGTKISRNDYEQAMLRNKGTLQEVSREDIENANRKDKILEAIGWQDKAGKPSITQGLAKTVGASGAIALGAGYTTPVTSLATLGKSTLAGAVGMEGMAMLEGRPATTDELMTAVAAEGAAPLIIKGTGAAFNKSKQAIDAYRKYKETNFTPLQNLEYSFKKGMNNTGRLINDKLINPIEAKISGFKDLSIQDKKGRISYSGTYVDKNLDDWYRSKIKTKNKLQTKTIQYENALDTHNIEVDLQHKIDNYYNSKNTDLLDERIQIPVNKSKLPLNQKIYQSIIESRVPSEQKRYFGYQKFDGEPFNFRTQYKTLQELEDAVNAGTFKPDENSRKEIGALIEEELKKYPNAKASGSSVLFRDGKINTYPQDIDLYVEDLIRRNEKHLYLAGNRKATNVLIPQIQKQITAYSDPEKYVKVNDDVVHYVLQKNADIRPDEFYPQQGLKDFDPNESSIMDAFMSNKPKHIERTHEMFGTLSEQELENAITKRRALLGHKDLDIPKFDFSDFDDNIEFLRRSGFSGDKQSLANNPKKMQLYFDNLYANKVLSSRQIEQYNGDKNNLFEYFNNDGGVGQRAYGPGIYYQKTNYGTNHGNFEAISELKLKKKLESPYDVLKGNNELFESVDEGFSDIIPVKDKNNILNSRYFYNDGSEMRFTPQSAKETSRNILNLNITRKATKIGQQPVKFDKAYSEWLKKMTDKRIAETWDDETLKTYNKLKKQAKSINIDELNRTLYMERGRNEDARLSVVDKINEDISKFRNDKFRLQMSGIGSGAVALGLGGYNFVKADGKRTDFQYFISNPELFNDKNLPVEYLKYANDIQKLRNKYATEKEAFNAKYRKTQESKSRRESYRSFREGYRSLRDKSKEYYDNLSSEDREKLNNIIDKISK